MKPIKINDFHPRLEPGEATRVITAIGELDEFKGLQPAKVESTEDVLTEDQVRQLCAAAPQPVEALIATTNPTFEDRVIHPIVAIARFTLEFIAIDPFADENHRVARELAALLLRRSGYSYVTSLDALVADRPRYDAALRGSVAATRKDPTQFGHWLLFFVNVLVAQQRAYQATLGAKAARLQLSTAHERILELARERDRVTSTAVTALLRIPPRTARYQLETLASRGYLLSHGEKRGRYYTLPFAT